MTRIIIIIIYLEEEIDGRGVAVLMIQVVHSF